MNKHSIDKNSRELSDLLDQAKSLTKEMSTEPICIQLGGITRLRLDKKNLKTFLSKRKSSGVAQSLAQEFYDYLTILKREGDTLAILPSKKGDLFPDHLLVLHQSFTDYQNFPVQLKDLKSGYALPYKLAETYPDVSFKLEDEE